MTLGLQIAASGVVCFSGLLLWAVAMYERYEHPPEWVRYLAILSIASILVGILIYIWGG